MKCNEYDTCTLNDCGECENCTPCWTEKDIVGYCFYLTLKKEADDEMDAPSNFCPDCGADMRKGGVK